MKSLSLFLINLVVFILLNFLDAHSTYLVIKKSNLKSEKNPIARFIFRKFGIIKGMFFLKMISIFLIPLMFWTYQEDPGSINSLLIFVNLLYSAVIINNYRIEKKLS